MASRDVPPAGYRRLDLGDGRTLVVRPVGRGDTEGLGRLYAGLSIDDLHNRFFSVFHPDRAFLERMASVADRGGYGLVAVVHGRPGDAPDGEVVAEAGYTPLANGNAELAITVSEPWRGWLGPFLLDALLEAAAAHGVPNLEADILVTNRPMLALARSRGVATMASDDWVSTRLVMGTAGRVPTWPRGHDRPRVLVEAPGGRWHAADAAREAGLQVLACSGPRRDRPRCPVLDGRPCPLAAGADAVVVSHPPDDPRWREVAAAHAVQHPGVPVCVEPAAASPEAPLPAGATVVAGDADDTAVVALVERLARRLGPLGPRPAGQGAGEGPGGPDVGEEGVDLGEEPVRPDP
jgi:hypothetical protein